MRMRAILRSTAAQLPVLTVLVSFLVASSPAEAGNGQGNGQGGDGFKKGCGDELVLYLDEQRLWSRDAGQLEAMPGVEKLYRGRRNEANGIELGLLIPEGEDIRSVEVHACGGQVRRIPVVELQRPGYRYFVVPNRREAFKLVELHRTGTPETQLKQLYRIVLLRKL